MCTWQIGRTRDAREVLKTSMEKLEILLAGAISGAEHEFPRETEVVSLVVGQRSLDELERALVLASEEEQGSIGGDVVAVQR